MYRMMMLSLCAILFFTLLSAAGMQAPKQDRVTDSYVRTEPNPVATQPLAPGDIRKFIDPVPDAVKLWDAIQAAESKYAQSKTDETKAVLLKAHFDFAERVMFHVNTPGQADHLANTKRYMVAYQSYSRVTSLAPEYVDEKCEVLRSLGITGEIVTTCPAGGRILTIVNIYISWGKPLPALK